MATLILLMLMLSNTTIVARLVLRHGDLSHKMTLSHEGRRPECDNVNSV